MSLQVSPSSSASTCYYPNGNPSTDVPCDSDALFTQCCGSRSDCLTNGLCILEASNDTGINYARGTCTDKTWASSLCPQQCQLNQDTPKNSSAYDFRTNGVQVWQCGSQGYGEEAKYCCESEAERQRCCSTATAVFTLGAAAVGASTGAVTTSASLSVSSIRPSLSEPTAMSSTLSESSITSMSSATASPTTAANKADNTQSTMLGAGVGGVVGLLVLVAVVVFFFRRHKREKMNMAFQGKGANELPGTATSQGGKQPAEIWTQPAEIWTQPQELVSQAPPAWELSSEPKMSRIR